MVQERDTSTPGGARSWGYPFRAAVASSLKRGRTHRLLAPEAARPAG